MINRPMTIAIISAGTGPRYYDLLNKKINQLIETSQCYLFYVLCGFTEGRNESEDSLGEIWAKRNGAPILYLSAKTTDELLDRLFKSVDYIFFLLDGNPLIKKALMKYKMMGKHGSVIRVNE